MKIKLLCILTAITILVGGCGITSKSDTTKENNSTAEEMKIADIGDVVIVESSSEEALEYSMQLKNGWNLGNTFDAVDDSGAYDGAGLPLEASWCGVYTTEELIDEVKAQGFNTIRIPVSWHNHLTGRGFEISERWLDRVQQIVDYAYENDMYVIINIHHDVYEQYYYPDTEHLENSKIFVKTIWQQLSIRFRDYDDKLIFECINEPRLVGKNNEWWLDVNNPECQDSMLAINELNQVFVDTVRESGGNNVNRYLLIPGYDSSPDGALADYFKLPNDIASHKLIVTVHAYLPYDLALDINGRSYFTDDDKKSIDDFMTRLNEKFVSQGIPVLIGEFGILNKNNIEDREAFTDYYVRAARDNGMVCLWWDNNAFDSGETFGLLRREDLVVQYPGIVEAIMRNTL